MTRIKRVGWLSAKIIAAFDEHSRAEWQKMRPLRAQFYQSVHGLWVIYSNDDPLCVIGVKKTTFIGSGVEVYFLICKAFNNNLKLCINFLRKAFRRVLRLYGMITVQIENGYDVGARFVKFFKFRPVPTLFEHAGVRYTNYELRASWL